MRIPIDNESKVPLYRQIEGWLRGNILSGSLPVDTRLPATRELAAKVGVSRITVKNAYASLESDGLILTRQGSGTFVAPHPDHSSAPDDTSRRDWPLWQIEAAGTRTSRPDVPNPLTYPGDLISFTGVGDTHQYPLKEFARTIQNVLRRDGVNALEYGPFDQGYQPLRQTIAYMLASQGIQAGPGEVLVTSGSQQALALICQALLKPGDAVLVEQPTYNMALELFRSLDLKMVGVPIDENGIRVEEMEPLLQQQHPKLIYTIPNFQNPSGACLSATRRRQLLVLSERYNIPILEDDYAGDLRFEGRALPAIKALDDAGSVIYTGTFSKMLMPGLRVGFLLARGPILERLHQLKRVQDLTTAPFIQRVLNRYVTVGRYQAHLRRSARLYRRRRNAMSAVIRRHLPGVDFSPPLGGLFLWCRLPEGISSRELLPAALDAGVGFSPGAWFFIQPAEGDAFLRLNFGAHSEEEIDLGIRRLASALRLSLVNRNGRQFIV